MMVPPFGTPFGAVDFGTQVGCQTEGFLVLLVLQQSPHDVNILRSGYLDVTSIARHHVSSLSQCFDDGAVVLYDQMQRQYRMIAVKLSTMFS